MSTHTHTTVLSTVPSTSSVVLGSPLSTSMLDGPSRQSGVSGNVYANPNGGSSTSYGSSSSSWRSSAPIRRAVSHDAVDRQEVHGASSSIGSSIGSTSPPDSSQPQWKASSTVRVTGSSGRPASGDPTHAVSYHVSSQQLRNSHIQQRMDIGTHSQVPATSTSTSTSAGSGAGSNQGNMRRVAPLAPAPDVFTEQSGTSNDKGERKALGRGLSHMRDMITSAMTHTHHAPSNN